MKTINLNYWAPCEWSVPVPITVPPVTGNINSFYTYNSSGLATFYYRLSGIVLYNVLYEDDYFYEDD